MRSEGYSTWFVCLSVCLSVTTILLLCAAQRPNKVPMDSTQKFKHFSKADFAKTTSLNSYGR